MCSVPMYDVCAGCTHFYFVWCALAFVRDKYAIIKLGLIHMCVCKMTQIAFDTHSDEA